jgi:rhodanese-related sulfurtransferase
MATCGSWWKCAMVQGGVIAAVAVAAGMVDRAMRPINMELAAPPPVVVPPKAPVAPVEPAVNPVANPQPAPAPVGTADQLGKAPAPAPTAPTTPPPKASDPASKLFISLQQLQVLMQQGVQLVDAREAHEFATGRIPGSVNLPPGGFSGPQASVVDNLLRDLPVVVYCGGGECDASKLVALKLQDRGYTTLYIYHDGYSGWTKAGMPVEK